MRNGLELLEDGVSLFRVTAIEIFIVSRVREGLQ